MGTNIWDAIAKFAEMQLGITQSGDFRDIAMVAAMAIVAIAGMFFIARPGIKKWQGKFILLVTLVVDALIWLSIPGNRVFGVIVMLILVAVGYRMAQSKQVTFGLPKQKTPAALTDMESVTLVEIYTGDEYDQARRDGKVR